MMEYTDIMTFTLINTENADKHDILSLVSLNYVWFLPFFYERLQEHKTQYIHPKNVNKS